MSIRIAKIPGADEAFAEGENKATALIRLSMLFLFWVRGGVPYSEKSDLCPVFRADQKPNSFAISQPISTLLVLIEPSMVHCYVEGKIGGSSGAKAC